MTRARPLVTDIERREAAPSHEVFGDVIPFMIPEPTYVALAHAAHARGLTVAEALALAITNFLETSDARNTSDSP